MLLYKGLTLKDFINMAEKILKTMGVGRVERHYQKCLMADLRDLGIPCACEDPVPIFYRGECVWMGRADLVVGHCCIELKAYKKPPSCASRQLEDYIREKNKVAALRTGTRPFWGVVVNFNKKTAKVEHLVLHEKGYDDEHLTDSDAALGDGSDEVIGSNVSLRNGTGKVIGVEMDSNGSRFFKVKVDEPGYSVQHKSLMRSLERFAECHLHKTQNPSEYVYMDELFEELERSCGKKIAGTEMALFVRRYLQRKYRVTWDRTFSKKRQVVYGGIGRGLALV